MRNIEEMLKGIKHGKIYKESGKFIIDINKQTETQKIKEILKNIPGISNFTLAVSCEKDIQKIREKAVEFVKSSQSSAERLRRGEVLKTFKS